MRKIAINLETEKRNASRSLPVIDLDSKFLLNKDVHTYNTRCKSDLHLDKVKRNWGKQRFCDSVFVYF